MNSFVSRLLLSFVLLVICKPGAQSLPLPCIDPPGITFFKGTWKDVLAEAKRQHKPVFLDVYTTWCPPCKRMANEAFPNSKIGGRYNVHFINYQLDAEKGEGIAIARQYLVASYPTSLFIAPNGDLIHRAVGYGGINAMLVQADHVLSLPRLKSTVAKGDKAYADGKRDPDFLKKYLQTRQSLSRPINDVLDAYIDALPASERTAAQTVHFVAETIQSADTKAFNLLITNRPGLLESDPAQERLSNAISVALYRVLRNDFDRAISTRDEQLLEKVITNSERNDASANPFVIRQEVQKQEASNDYRLKFHKQTQNFARYQTIAEPIARDQLMSQAIADLHEQDSIVAIRMQTAESALPDSIRNNPIFNPPMKKHIASWKVARSLYEIADTYRTMGTSATQWEAALAWAERSVRLYRTHDSLHTFAQLLQKLGRIQEAVYAQKEAIREAEKEGWPMHDYEAELADMSRN
ncbi:thioredoxin fold domain-containing protein [Spirosoma sp.]|uniref:thioredoxin fold domain-containing protein n=1 Tax=Spirosoma sp. TaxID=1899569 RepID=UPI00261DE5A4|nr:thioredoxin fold domain-containing protein [Spirosoma sp.]MCX6218065.1 thioredoxin family protein [Spirosoma sp.]